MPGNNANWLVIQVRAGQNSVAEYTPAVAGRPEADMRNKMDKTAAYSRTRQIRSRDRTPAIPIHRDDGERSNGHDDGAPFHHDVRLRRDARLHQGPALHHRRLRHRTPHRRNLRHPRQMPIPRRPASSPAGQPSGMSGIIT
jgi:hypothetical protein